jgi:hypothetical protein
LEVPEELQQGLMLQLCCRGPCVPQTDIELFVQLREVVDVPQTLSLVGVQLCWVGAFVPVQ